jgi:predicted acylesterase/phospholipase RssA
MFRAPTASGLVLFALLSSGCAFFIPDRIHYSLQPLERTRVDECARPHPEHSRKEVFGVALSGGGSRAAVFGAAALEALWEHGLVGEISHISSVSGGSLAAAYFVANKPACEEAASQVENKACWREFFAEFQDAMRQDYLWSTFLQNSLLNPNRATSSTRRVTSFQELADRRFLHGKTFGELKPGGPASDTLERPVLLINATSYDDSRRFVFSNLCFPESGEDETLGSIGPGELRDEPLKRKALCAKTFSRVGCTRPVPSDFPLSLAVANSAAFPFAFGPLAMEIPPSCGVSETEYWHLGDGGLIDNTGTETLGEIVLRELQAGRLERSLNLSVDAGKRAMPDTLREKNLRMWTRRAFRFFDMPLPRGDAYHEIFWEAVRRDAATEGVSIEAIKLDYMMAGLDQWPDSCGKKEKGQGRERDAEIRAAIRAHVANIGTSLSISECDADLMEAAAHKVVHDTFSDETVRQLRDQGFFLTGARRPSCVLDESESP